MLKFLKIFAQEDSGVATTDFLVLTAVVVTMGLAGINSISTGSNAAAVAVAAGIDTMDDEF